MLILKANTAGQAFSINNGILVSNYGSNGTHSGDWVKDAGNPYGSPDCTFDAHQPDLVIITLGGSNEFNGSISAAQYGTNLGTLITYIKNNTDADIILHGCRRGHGLYRSADARTARCTDPGRRPHPGSASPMPTGG